VILSCQSTQYVTLCTSHVTLRDTQLPIHPICHPIFIINSHSTSKLLIQDGRLYGLYDGRLYGLVLGSDH